MNERPPHFETTPKLAFKISKESLRQALKDTGSKVTEFEACKNNSETHAQQYDLLQTYLKVLNSFRALKEADIPETWEELTGNTDHETNPVPVLCKNEAGKWQIKSINVATPQELLEHVDWAHEILSPENEEIEPSTDIMKLVQSRMPQASQARYNPQPGLAKEQVADKDPLKDKFQKAKLGNTTKKKGWFGR